ncbi:hypothetical protein MHK_005891, partial [Candidatus Magnetomorum sp. HK-1]
TRVTSVILSSYRDVYNDKGSAWERAVEFPLTCTYAPCSYLVKLF